MNRFFAVVAAFSATAIFPLVAADDARWIWHPGDYGIWWGNELQSERLQWGPHLISDSSWNVGWTTAASVRGGKGGTETVELKPSAARKLRVKGLRRNTGYGISLFSLSVYGSQSKPDKK